MKLTSVKKMYAIYHKPALITVFLVQYPGIINQNEKKNGKLFLKRQKNIHSYTLMISN